MRKTKVRLDRDSRVNVTLPAGAFADLVALADLRQLAPGALARSYLVDRLRAEIAKANGSGEMVGRAVQLSLFDQVKVKGKGGRRG
jgi:uncharacterized membrane protein YdfJ with MMPL/SSD domain